MSRRKKRRKFRMPPENTDVVLFPGHPGRYVIVDVDTGEVFDDANGYGYTSKPKAYAALSYKRKRASGQPTRGDLVRKWLRENKAVSDGYRDAIDCCFKEIARGEVTCEELLEDVMKRCDCTALPSGIGVKTVVKYFE